MIGQQCMPYYYLLDELPNKFALTLQFDDYSMSAYESTCKISQYYTFCRTLQLHSLNGSFCEYLKIILLFFLIFGIGLSCAVFYENKRHFRSHVLYDFPYDSNTSMKYIFNCHSRQAVICYAYIIYRSGKI